MEHTSRHVYVNDYTTQYEQQSIFHDVITNIKYKAKGPPNNTAQRTAANRSFNIIIS